MGIPVASTPAAAPVQADTSASSSSWWWVPNAVIAICGVALVAIGDLGNPAHATDIVTAGLAAVVAAGAHAAGKQSPAP